MFVWSPSLLIFTRNRYNIIHRCPPFRVSQPLLRERRARHRRSHTTLVGKMRVLRVQDKYIVGAKTRVGVFGARQACPDVVRVGWKSYPSKAGGEQRRFLTTLPTLQLTTVTMRPWYRRNGLDDKVELSLRKFLLQTTFQCPSITRELHPLSL